LADQQKIPLIFYRLRPGLEPVREWLKKLPEADRHAIGKDLLRAQWRWPVGMPLCRPMGQGLWEIRRPADETNGACAALRLPGAPRRAAWFYQEDAHDAGSRSGLGAQTTTGVRAMSKKHMGSGIDTFLKEQGIFEETQAAAVREVVAWQLAEAMKKQKISKNKMATLLKTSRTQVDRLLNPKTDITISSLQRAAAMVGRRVSIELV
jgi:predicted XRE-type DNA-binding protein